MNQSDIWLISNSKYFKPEQVPAIKYQLDALPQDKLAMLSAISFYDPTTAIIVSIFAGTFGIDRFIIGDTGLGIGKLLTCGGMGIWAIVDWFLITNHTKEKNYMKLMQTLAMY